MKTKASDVRSRKFEELRKLGLNDSEIRKLSRASAAIRSWDTACCNGDVGEDDDGSAYDCRKRGLGPKWPIANRRTIALRRVAQILTTHPGLWFYHQGDPRGVSLYVGKLSELRERKIALSNLDCYYSSAGHSVYLPR